MPDVKRPAMRSVKAAMEEQKRIMEIPDDIGLLPETFVTPVMANRPKLLKDPRGRFKWERRRIYNKGRDILSAAVLKNIMVSTRPPSELKRLPWYKRYYHYIFGPKIKLEVLQVPKIAQKLYEEMYTKFASGEIASMKPRLCESIFDSLSSRASGRAPNTYLKWTLHRYLGSPKLVSYRTTILRPDEPKHERSYIQQAVVRIRSMQSLRKVRKVREKNGKTSEILEEGSVSGNGEEGKEVTEYFVIQKMVRKGIPGNWMVWGTTEETTLEKIVAAETRLKGR